MRGDRLVLERNDAYWGPKPTWTKVTFKPLSNNAARVAALLSNGVDVIENPPTTDLKKLKENPNVTITQAVSNRLIYIHLDSFRDPTPGIPDAAKNPLKDLRVRKALALAINRDAIANRVMEGLGIPAADFLVYPFFGTRKDTPPIPFAPEEARKLLAEAGYPNGFKIDLHCTNDRLPGDGAICQGLGQMFSQAGIQTNVNAISRTVYFPAQARKEYSIFMNGWGTLTGEASYTLGSLAHSMDDTVKMGAFNRIEYKNPDVDKALQEGARTLDDTKRRALFEKAMELTVADRAYIPVVVLQTVWAGAKDKITMKARVDEDTLAYYVAPAK